MRYLITVHWTNLEGDGFSCTDTVEAPNEDAACEILERRCLADLDDVASVWTEGYAAV